MTKTYTLPGQQLTRFAIWRSWVSGYNDIYMDIAFILDGRAIGIFKASFAGQHWEMYTGASDQYGIAKYMNVELAEKRRTGQVTLHWLKDLILHALYLNESL